MAKMAELHARGITNLRDYVIGRQDEREDMLRILEQELAAADKLYDTDMVEICTHLIQSLNAFPITTDESV
ncbi:hypothetical protein UFOVP225_119 [uncultured Caudovirales phage]|uniref:Uncharacterized protein n=1 Tax=uncultured Caudovirales phage TaxID=2100421 RepID=A0A6J5L857_9CAUD|nr:hypothetical protein UFOVP113_132 [uncultured Caudovirales phage]CAB5219728.1 hypothetical protein UFOVP225_119 [uncultured Caudovirales phage]